MKMSSYRLNNLLYPLVHQHQHLHLLFPLFLYGFLALYTHLHILSIHHTLLITQVFLPYMLSPLHLLLYLNLYLNLCLKFYLNLLPALLLPYPFLFYSHCFTDYFSTFHSRIFPSIPVSPPIPLSNPRPLSLSILLLTMLSLNL